MTLVFSEAMPEGLYAPKPLYNGALRYATTQRQSPYVGKPANSAGSPTYISKIN